MRLLSFVALVTVAAALPEMFLGRRKGGFTSHLLEQANIDPFLLASEHVGAGKITQKLDHFDKAIPKTWEQRYFYNHEYATNDSKLNILYLTGEQIGGAEHIVGEMVSYVYYAKQMSADLYSLEHRFYGGSHPTDNTSVENLKYFSSQQAIEDIAEFIRHVNEKKGTAQKWIVVGGSYAGALSAWSRLRHPELISGAIASSGPVLAQMDFYGYLQTVDINFQSQGGLCYSQLGDGLERTRQLLQSKEGRANLTDIFKITPPLSDYEALSDYDKDTFFGYLVSPFMGSAQYSSPTLEDLCKLFTIGGPDADPVKAFAQLPQTTGFNVNFTIAVEELSGIEFEGDISMRLWFYQTCAEFGYFQSTNRGTNVFGETQSTNSYIEYCVRLFGIDADQIEKNIESTNEYYGERDHYAGTNVVFSHGTQDPWSFLTKKSDPQHESVVIVEVEGGSHCSDIGLSCFYPGVTCTDNLKEIQELTLDNMKKWIDPTIVVSDGADISDNVGKRPIGFEPTIRQSSLSASSKLRAKKPVDDSTYSNKYDYKTWNKFTGKGRRYLPPPPSESQNEQPSELVGQATIEQTWDHFNASETRTFKQKWYYNYKFGSKDGPNFLMIGGEGPESDYFITNEGLAWMIYAKEVGANLFNLEHRYYGESKLGTNDLQYLTSSQALYDLATFIKTQKVNQNLTGPWITFGGSYPGALAAWSREWFPELIVGAVGSSAPVLAKNDFYEYLEVVEDVFKRQSQKCYNRTSEAFQALENLAENPDGRAIIQDKFNLEPQWTSDPNQTISDVDLNSVFSGLAAMYMRTVQYNKVDWSDIASLCSYFEDDTVDSLDALSSLRYHTHGQSPLWSNYSADLEYYKEMKSYVDGHDHGQIYDDFDLSSVLWTWQTCNEFGYYQTTDYGEGIFGMTVPLNFFIIMCEQVFDVNMDQVVESISRTNKQYGGRNKFNTTNVVLPNGDGDPWHALGIVEQGSLDESVVPVLIKGTSHCADMYPATDNDPTELTQARQTILENIKKWLAPYPTKTVTPTTTNVLRTASTVLSSRRLLWDFTSFLFSFL